MFRSRWFWVAYVMLAAMALLLAARLFPLAIPIVNLDVKVSREEAIARAEAEASRLRLVAADHRAAVRFDHDGATQNYVELEGGGKEAFARLTSGTLYAPYWWEVRLFTPGVIEEATLRFKPDGTPNGFTRRVAETYVRDPATKALDSAAARVLAVEAARRDWGLDLSSYTLLDESHQVRPSGRVDHGFDYERPEALGEARVRLRLSVAGDELVGITPFVHIPESFGRRYQSLRSANNLIASLASVAAGVLYGLVGCVLAVLWLARQHWLLWRPALVAGLIVGALLALSSLAAAPGAWFGVDTTETSTTFWLRQVGAAVLIFTAGGLAYALVFMAAESLSRRAFGHQPQLWRLWSRHAGASVQTAGRTVGGYLFVPVELALIALFYYATNRYFGWWQPSELMTDPNVLGSAVPALTPIAISLQAGFMEESLFRAIPLSLGALIGARYGRRTLGIAIAFVLQALVFGGAHANYPGFPAFSRPIELLLPSMVWALIFLRFGLLPTALLHAVFDLSLFAIPVFLVDAPGARAQQALIIGAGLVPLAIVAIRRLQAGQFFELPDSLRNRAWMPDAAMTTQAPAAAAPLLQSGGLATAFQRALPVIGLAGLIAWIAFTPFRADAPGIPGARETAEAAADAAIASRGYDATKPFRRSIVIREANDDAAQWLSHKFVWREGGAEAYRRLLGTWLAPPVWDVRYALFEGDVAERAEEWRVTVAAGPEVRTVRHTLPEARAGARLGHDAALALAMGEIALRFNASETALRVVAAEEARRTERTDWSFTLGNPAVKIPAGGEARYLVVVAGDRVAASGRYIYVPEAWQREEADRDSRAQIATMGASILLIIAALGAVLLGVLSFTRHHCDTRALWLAAAIAFVVNLLVTFNSWPVFVATLRTAEPLASQWTVRVLLALAGTLVVALFAGLTAGVGSYGARVAARHRIAGVLPYWAAAIAASLFLLGLQAAATAFAPRVAPLWPGLQWASVASPFAAAVLGGINFVQVAAVALFAFYVLARVTSDWTRRAWLVILVLLLLQLAGALAQSGGAIGRALLGGLAGGLATAAVLWLLLRYDARMLPPFVATGAIAAGVVRAAQGQSASGWIDFAAGSAVLIVIAVLVTRYIGKPMAMQPPASEADPERSPATAS